MPDSQMVIARPQVGMYIFYEKSHLGYWVLKIHSIAPFITYDFIRDISTYDVARHMPYDKWDTERYEYSFDDWVTFVDRGTTVRILNPEIMEPAWEV